MKMIRVTHEVWKKNGDIYLTVTVIRRLAKRVGKKPKGGNGARSAELREGGMAEGGMAEGPARNSASGSITASQTASPNNSQADGEGNDDAISENVVPADWVFDDGARTVDLGGGQVMKLGRTQYGLLKYIAQGGRSTQEAWEQVWEYSSPVEWRTIKDAARHINERFGKCAKACKIEVTTREVKIFIPENTD